jgi:hypothetical protein
MLAANGTAANQVIVESHTTPVGVATADAYVLASMDTWLTNIDADHSSHGLRTKVVKDKPAGLGDACYLSTGLVRQPLTYPATGPCAADYAIGADPRLEAGTPLAEPALKCALRPLNFTDYPTRFTRTEQTQLRRAFPTGVCDFTRPGPGQNEQPTAWHNYGDH